MASMKDAYIVGPDHTAIKYLDGKRVLMGYPTGSIFMAKRDGFNIMYKLSAREAEKHAKSNDWQPLLASSR